MAKKKEEETLEINLELKMDVITFRLRGDTPLILNRLAEKARQQLLMPPPKKNAAEKAASLKHDPMMEFRSSVYRTLLPGPTRLLLPGGAFKKCISTAALDIPGATKSRIGRLTNVPDINVSVYGTPKIMCSVVRSADINRTPDIRTRAILPEWCALLRVQFARPLVTEKTVTTLLAAAGMIVGVGDFRSEKGAGSYGSFSIVNEDDEDFIRISEEQGRESQDAALENPDYYDHETEELLTWFHEELVRRDRAPKAEPTKKGKKKASADEDDADGGVAVMDAEE